jgi:hypothetical protein
VDGVLLSVRHGSTRADQLVETAGALERVGADVLGVVLTMVPVKSELAAAHGHGFDYGYAPGRRPQARPVPAATATDEPTRVTPAAPEPVPAGAKAEKQGNRDRG